MVGLAKAKIRARAAIESQYNGICSVIQFTDVTDPVTKLTRKKETVVIENQPCQLSFESLKTAQQTDSAAGISQIVKLFIAPELDIKEGSKITVTQYGKNYEYQVSGVPAVYFSHQEILLDIFRGWS